jgi:hypothetical protein
VVGFRFLGATKAIITFNSHDIMQKGIETWITPWKSIFSDIKPLVREDKADDRFAWVIILGVLLI